MNKETAPRRFGPDFVAGQLDRYGKRPPESRMLSYDLAVLDEYEPWRIWLDEQLDLLPDATAAVFAANLWRDQNFWPNIIELAAGAALRRKSLTVEFERRWGTLTPDWTVLDEAGVPVALVEVLTHSPQLLLQADPAIRLAPDVPLSGPRRSAERRLTLALYFLPQAEREHYRQELLTSAVHRFDLIDRQRNEVSLPRQEWEIAEALREYTRLVKAEPSNPRSGRVAALLDTRRRALRASLDGIARRVKALEAYAEQVAQADDRYRELQQIQALTDGSGDVLDFLARTVRDDFAVAEIEGMTGEAVAVADAFTMALESAKEAAVIALPTRTIAA
ncbi:hypothetical protein AB0N79_35400 [Streptomyces microflavus]|uniref:hypothetical protein n=1 Tax=Streptomyces microflavus TaxID=1919 RepID=UPI003419A75F